MRKRNLSEFMCIEMLYDYKSDKLDPLRKQAVEESIQNSPRVREELKKLSQGLSYVERLKSIKVSEPLIEVIQNQPKPAQKILNKIAWSSLPQPLRWGIEGIVVSVAVVLFAFQYDKLFKSDKLKEQSVVYKKFEVEGEKIESAPAPTPTPAVAEKPIILAQTQNVEAPAPESNLPAQSVLPQEMPTPKPATQTVVAEALPKTQEKKGNAYLYRLAIYVNNVDAVTPEIVRLVKSLGGEKAGEVELGWRRKGGSYFHFAMPKVNNQLLQNGLKKYSTVNIIKSNHPRVMPEDMERFILWVEEKKPQEVPGAADVNQKNEGLPTDGNQDSH